VDSWIEEQRAQWSVSKLVNFSVTTKSRSASSRYGGDLASLDFMVKLGPGSEIGLALQNVLSMTPGRFPDLPHCTLDSMHLSSLCHFYVECKCSGCDLWSQTFRAHVPAPPLPATGTQSESLNSCSRLLICKMGIMAVAVRHVACRVRWCAPISPATREAEVGG
jgi:hypothetical protein